MGANESTNHRVDNRGPEPGAVEEIFPSSSKLYYGTSARNVCEWEYPDAAPMERGPPRLIGELLLNIENHDPNAAAHRRSGNWIDDFQCGIEVLASECFESGDRQEWATGLNEFVAGWNIQPAEGFALLRSYLEALPTAMLPEPHAIKVYELVRNMSNDPVEANTQMQRLSEVFSCDMQESGHAVECVTLRFIVARSAFQRLSVSGLARFVNAFQKPAAKTPKLDLTPAFELIRKNLGIVGMLPPSNPQEEERNTLDGASTHQSSEIVGGPAEEAPQRAQGSMIAPEESSSDDEEPAEDAGVAGPAIPATVPPAASLATVQVDGSRRSSVSSIPPAVVAPVIIATKTSCANMEHRTMDSVLSESLSTGGGGEPEQASSPVEENLERARQEFEEKRKHLKAEAVKKQASREAAKEAEAKHSRAKVQHAEEKLKHAKLAFQTSGLPTTLSGPPAPASVGDREDSVPSATETSAPSHSAPSHGPVSVAAGEGHLQIIDALAQLTQTVMQLQETVSQVVSDQEIIKTQVREVKSEILHSVPPLQTATALIAKEHQLVAEELVETQKIVQIESDRVGSMRKDIESATMASVQARQGTEDSQLRWISLERAQLEQKQLISSLRDQVAVANRETSRLRQENDSTKVDLALLQKRFNSRGAQFM